jgi:hypothetical protein
MRHAKGWDELLDAPTTDFWFFANLRDGVRDLKQSKQKYRFPESGLSLHVRFGMRQPLSAAFAFKPYVLSKSREEVCSYTQ